LDLGEKCIERFAVSAEKSVKFLLSQEKGDPSFVGNVIRNKEEFKF
jgi:hypothetical protein